MPNNDTPAEPNSPPRPRAPPSLMGATDAAARAGPDSDGGLRMLTALQSPGQSSARQAAGVRVSKLATLLGAVVVAAAVAWWWSHAASSAPRATAPARVAQAGTARPAEATPSAVTPDRAVTEATAARIEPTAEASVAQAVAATRIALAAPATDAARPPAPAAKPVPKHLVAKPAGVATASAAARRAERPLAAPAAVVADAKAAKLAKSADADVVLLSALLAHVSRSGAAGTLALAEQDQITIAQIVQRCEARGGEEARECRRRICDGYWGKAEACPAPANPKKG